MALIAIDYSYAGGGQYFYGVISDLSPEQVNNILASDPLSIEDYFDTSYDFDWSSFREFTDGDQIGYYYYIDEDTDFVEVNIINGGKGGIASADRNSSENVVTEAFSLSMLLYNDSLYASIDFRPVTFLSKVVAPVSSWIMQDVLLLAFLSVTFVSFGIRAFGKAARSLGRGR